MTYWQRFRSCSPSGRISGSTIGTMPFYETLQSWGVSFSHSIFLCPDLYRNGECFMVTWYHCGGFHTNLLADACISSKNISILKDGQLRWCGVADLEHAAPLGEVCAVLLVLRTALGQPIQTYSPRHTSIRNGAACLLRVWGWRVCVPLTLGGCLSVCSSEGYNTFVHL